jgi:hypothetical protein
VVRVENCPATKSFALLVDDLNITLLSFGEVSRFFKREIKLNSSLETHGRELWNQLSILLRRIGTKLKKEAQSAFFSV